MNKEIKEGAEMFVSGVKEEAKEAVKKIAQKHDSDGDGKIEAEDVGGEFAKSAKEALDKLESVLKDDDLPEKAKKEISEAMEDLKKEFKK